MWVITAKPSIPELKRGGDGLKRGGEDLKRGGEGWYGGGPATPSR
jgi:hypothetical protein